MNKQDRKKEIYDQLGEGWAPDVIGARAYKSEDDSTNKDDGKPAPLYEFLAVGSLCLLAGIVFAIVCFAIANWSLRV